MKRVLTGVLLLALTACGGEADGGEDPTADSTAERIEQAVDSVAETEALTEDSDPNELLGRPNGYTAAVVIYDERVECDGPGASCGATVEEWPDADAAQERSDYISGLLEDSPALGSEYHYLDGPVLVRVTGELKPSEAEEYESAVD